MTLPRQAGVAVLVAAVAATARAQAPAVHQERPGDPATCSETTSTEAAAAAAAGTQVNVDASGRNVPGDAANEPSIAIDPRSPARMAIGWRQFDAVSSNFRQAGVAYSVDGGASWRSVGPLEAGNFRSDPVLHAGPDGTFYYYSLSGTPEFSCQVFRSGDGGASWGAPIAAHGGDKAWMVVDSTGGPGNGHVYVSWSPYYGCCGTATFTRSVDGGLTWSSPVPVAGTPVFGTLAVARDGTLYVAGLDAADFRRVVVARSTTARDASQAPSFDGVAVVDLGGANVAGPVNPAGLLGQVWVATGPSPNLVYLLCSLDPPGPDPLDVMFSRSSDGGVTWSPARSVVNDDAGRWQWFGTMSVAPGGRIDVVWNDTPADLSSTTVHHAASYDGGASFAAAAAVTPAFNQSVGYPNQAKLGDYYHMISDDAGASLAYAATFNGEQDVYFLRISSAPPFDADIDDSGLVDGWDLIRLGISFGLADGQPGFDAPADIDGSGTVDGADLALLASVFGRRV